MKISKPGMKISKPRLVNGLATGVAILGFLGGGQFAKAQFSLGDAASYAVLFEGGGHNNLDLSGPDTFYGNLGVGAPAGSTPGAQLSGQLTLNDDVTLNFAGAPGADYQNSATFPSGPGGPYSLTVRSNVGQVQTDLNYLNTLSTTLGAESGSNLTVNINNNQSFTLQASTGTLDTNGNRVFTMSSWNFGGGSTLTINGNGSNSVVINDPVSAVNNPMFKGAIVLTGGLTPDQVLFNFTGGSGLTGGPTLTINDNGVTEYGTFLDPNGQMSMDNSVLDGHFFGGDTGNDQVVSGAAVEIPMSNVPEPAPVALLAMSLVLCGMLRLRVRTV